ncbi:hypothetical protein FBU59_004325 [Linderina macrospora]|uniref:Uncharacterized protein n=1 Tax=Linderina macrospora TaxID=4868 RepID=A0ACC1J631_9FUNG|nr:hypothetical protein FBU59_004325 [Linderina macrospora]
MLGERAEQLTQQLAELQAEEEMLVRTASSADAEVSRMAAAYQGSLDEAALATQNLASTLNTPAGNSMTGQPTKHYVFQCGDEVAQLRRAVEGYMAELGQFIETGMRKMDTLPSPWKEFEPFATQSVAELLDVAKREHGRITSDLIPMTRLKMRLNLERELLRAAGDEADKAMASGDLLQRCGQYVPNGVHDDKITSSVSMHAARLSGAALGNLVVSGQVQRFGDVTKQLQQQWNMLAECRGYQQNRDLEMAAHSIGPQRQAAEEIVRKLAEEHAALADLDAMWTVVATSLERDNAVLEKKKVSGCSTGE